MEIIYILLYAIYEKPGNPAMWTMAGFFAFSESYRIVILENSIKSFIFLSICLFLQEIVRNNNI